MHLLRPQPGAQLECAPIRLGRARLLAAQLGAEYRHIETLAPLAGAT